MRRNVAAHHAAHGDDRENCERFDRKTLLAEVEERALRRLAHEPPHRDQGDYDQQRPPNPYINEAFNKTAVNVRNLVVAQRRKNNESAPREASEACPGSLLEFLECVLPESNSTGQALNLTGLFSAQHKIPNEATELCECEQDNHSKGRAYADRRTQQDSPSENQQKD